MTEGAPKPCHTTTGRQTARLLGPQAANRWSESTPTRRVDLLAQMVPQQVALGRPATQQRRHCLSCSGHHLHGASSIFTAAGHRSTRVATVPGCRPRRVRCLLTNSVTCTTQRARTLPLTCGDGSRDWTRTSNPSVSRRHFAAILAVRRNCPLTCAFAPGPVLGTSHRHPPVPNEKRGIKHVLGTRRSRLRRGSRPSSGPRTNGRHHHRQPFGPGANAAPHSAQKAARPRDRQSAREPCQAASSSPAMASSSPSPAPGSARSSHGIPAGLSCAEIEQAGPHGVPDR